MTAICAHVTPAAATLTSAPFRLVTQLSLLLTSLSTSGELMSDNTLGSWRIS